MNCKLLSTVTVGAAVLAGAGDSALAQVPLTLPLPSQRATVSQTVGLTEVAITYHRPVVKGRKIWGDLVPYGQVWRAGANENTTISFSSPVSVGGKQLPAGTYGLHVLPTEREWTFILSNVSWAWGSFSYDQAEDAARVTAVPEAAPFVEHLTYTIDQPGSESAVVSLHWEKLAASFPIRIDAHEVVLASIRHELRGLPRFSWQGWEQAARYCLQEKVNLDEGLAWADRSIALAEHMPNLITKAGLLDLKGDAKQAADLRAKGISIGTEAEVNAYGYQLLGQGKTDEAIELFTRNVKDHPQSWNVYDSLGEALAAKGDKALALQNYTKARAMAPEAQHQRVDGILARLRS
jgi:hypothetical protein